MTSGSSPDGFIHQYQKVLWLTYTEINKNLKRE